LREANVVCESLHLLLCLGTATLSIVAAALPLRRLSAWCPPSLENQELLGNPEVDSHRENLKEELAKNHAAATTIMKLLGASGTVGPVNSSNFFHYTFDYKNLSRRTKVFALFFILMFAIFVLYEIRLASERGLPDNGIKGKERPQPDHKPHSSIEDSIHNHPIAIFLILFVIVLHIGAIVCSTPRINSI